jgi:Predicted integral membrane protein
MIHIIFQIQTKFANSLFTFMKPSLSRARIFFYIFCACVFIFATYYFADIKKDFSQFKKVNVFWLVLAILSQSLTYFFSAIIYKQLLSVFNVKIKLGLWKLFQASIVALFFNQAIPSAGISGNTFFFNFLRKRNIPPHYIFSLIVIELLTFYAAMEMIVIVLFFICSFLYKVPVSFTIILGAGFFVYLVFGTGISLLGRKHTVGSLYKKIGSSGIVKKFLSGFKRSFKGISIEEMKNPWYIFRHDSKRLLPAVIWQLLIFLADAFSIFALFSGLGITVQLVYVFAGLMLTKIISILPFSPGSLILYESSMSFFFSRMGVPLGGAIVVTLLYRALSFWLPIPVGLFFYRRFQVKEK